MSEVKRYQVVLFYSVSHTLRAEKLLKKEKIPIKVIPIPRHISSNCGVCIRFLEEHREQIEKALEGRVDFDSIHSFNPR
ncbi:MAG: DUF3343 domain-containing protein [Desulfobacterales bacterium]|nr:DUF3343 domain-containing protein [Desulfobacterales bacterium]